MSKKVPIKKHPGGRPTKFRWDEKTQARLERLYRDGYTDKQVAFLLEIKEQTITNWKKRHPKFFASVKDWKVGADGEIEVSLYKRACGYSHPEIKFFSTATGIESVETIKHYPPDPTSMIFWLKNRQPEKWRDRSDVELTDKSSETNLELATKLQHLITQAMIRKRADSSGKNQ